MSFFSSFFNKALIWQQTGEQHLFWQEATHFQQVQSDMLLNIVAQNQNTLFGSHYNFSHIKNYNDYVSQVPIFDDWAEMEPWINQVAAGHQNILTTAKVMYFEETSGSTGFSKLIPYTQSLTRSFERALSVWITELNDFCPAACRGKSYWSISPVLKSTRRTIGNIPIGVNSDVDYFSSFISWLLRQIIVKPNVTKETDQDIFYFNTLRQLLDTPDLSLISVWSPTFFLQLDSYLQAHHQHLKIANQGVWSEWFPNLVCVSCWADAQASIWIDRVRQRLGNVLLQEKGLLSTEGIITFPVGIPSLKVLAYRSHFFEFRDQISGSVGPVDILLEGKDYEVILTNGSGLYRYATHDVVKFDGWYRQIPILTFQGRGSAICDMVGEKLSEQQVIAAITASYFTLGYTEVLCAPFPQAEKGYAVYKLLVFEKKQEDFDDNAALQRCEEILCRNPYYQQALNTRQLAPLQLVCLKESPVRQLSVFLQTMRQIKAGDIKIPILLPLSYMPQNLK